MSALASDNFNRANETPLAPGTSNGTPWALSYGANGFNLNTNLCVTASLLLDAGAHNTTVVIPDNQYSQAAVSVTGGGAGAGYGVSLRQAPSLVQTLYRIVVSKAASLNVELDSFVTGTNALIASRTTTWVDGDILKAVAIGSVIKIFQNGVQLGADIPTVVVTTGLPGIAYSSTASGGNVDNWEGGSLDGAIQVFFRPFPFAPGGPRFPNGSF